MRKVNVEIAEDASRSEGGYAVILLHGVATLPDGARFRIKPVDVRDSSENEAAESWPKCEHRPVAVRQTEFGIEIVIGPEIVECPALLPGTVGVIEIAQAGVRGEFLWPSIRPTARPRRRHLSLVKPQRTSASPAAGSWALPSDMPVASSDDSAAATAGVPEMPTIQLPALDDAPRIVANVSSVTHAKADQLPGGDARVTFNLDPAPGKVPTADELFASAHGRTGATTAPPPLPMPVSEAVDTSHGGDDAAGHALLGVEPPAREPEAGSRPTTAPRAAARYAAIAAGLLLAVAGGSYQFSGSDTTGTDAAAKAVKPSTVAEARTASQPPPLDPAPRATKPEPAYITSQTGDEQSRREEIQRAIARQQAASIAPMPEPASGHTAVTAAEPQTSAPMPPAQPTPEASAGREANTESEVTLRMRGGGFQVTGQLRGYDGTKFVIETLTSGTMTMDASRFECQGAACARPAAAILAPTERPSPLRPDNYVVEGSMALGNGFLPELVKAYAASVGAKVVSVAGTTERAAKYRIEDSRGMELATIAMEAQTSATALASLEQGNAALALIERPVGIDDEARQSPSGRRTPTVVEHLIGLDGIAAVVSPKRDLKSISLDILAKLFSGQIGDWVELGLAPGPIQLYLPQDASGTAELFNRLVLRPRGLKPAGTPITLKSDAVVAEAVAKDANGLALVSFPAIKGVRALNLEMQCGLIARPTAFGVKAEEYPLARRLYLVAPAQPAQPSARGILRIAQSPEIGQAISTGGVVDQSITALTLAEQSERMAWAINAPATAFDMGEMRQMLADLNDMSRLSLTLRFNSNNELDARSKREIVRLATALKEPSLAGKKVLLAGFTDLSGRFQQNLTLGLKRAGQVRAALLAAAGPGLDQRLVTAKGYGPLAPVGCSNAGDGQRLNRRVEVWVANDVVPKSAAR